MRPIVVVMVTYCYSSFLSTLYFCSHMIWIYSHIIGQGLHFHRYNKILFSRPTQVLVTQLLRTQLKDTVSTHFNLLQVRYMLQLIFSQLIITVPIFIHLLGLSQLFVCYSSTYDTQQRND